MVDHTEHGWTLHPMQGQLVTIPTWKERTGPTGAFEVSRWDCDGIGLLLRGLSCVIPQSALAKDLAPAILPPTSCRWKGHWLYEGRNLAITGPVELRSGAMSVRLPDEPLQSPNPAQKLPNAVYQLSAVTLAARAPRHAHLYLAALVTLWPNDEAKLSRALKAKPAPIDDPWRAIRRISLEDHDYLKAMSNAYAVAEQDPTIVVLWRQACDALKVPDMTIREVIEAPDEDPRAPLRDLIRKLTRLPDPTPHHASMVIRKVDKLCKSRLHAGITRWRAMP